VYHPVAFAGWVGLLVTAFNLLPAGQLDGGHIVRALFGERAKFLSFTVILGLLAMAFFTGFYTWGLFAVFILFMGAKHPPPLDDISPIKNRQKIIGIASIAIMILCFHPIPMEISETFTPEYDFDVSTQDSYQSIYLDQTGVIEFNISNTGNINDDYIISYEMMALENRDIIDMDNLFQTGNFTSLKSSMNNFSKWSFDLQEEDFQKDLKKGKNSLMSLELDQASEAEIGDGLAIRVIIVSNGDPDLHREMEYVIRISSFGFKAQNSFEESLKNSISPFGIDIINPSNDSLDLRFEYEIIKVDAPTRGWSVNLNRSRMLIDPGMSQSIELQVKAPREVYQGNTIVVRVIAINDNSNDIAMVEVQVMILKTYIDGTVI